MAAGFGAPSAATPEGEPASATPQRPSLSFGTGTVPDRRLEMEIGGLLVDGGNALPVFLKYGLTDHTEIELGFDAFRSTETPKGTRTSAGDLMLGLRSRRAESDSGRSLALAGWAKFPTAGDETGSGEMDAGLIGILSDSIGAFALDTNLWLSALGQEGNTVIGQMQAVVTLGLPGGGGWSPFAEIAWQRTATLGSGGFADAGVTYAASPHAVFDIAAGIGRSRGYPEWTVTAGWTLLLGAAGR